MPTPFGKKPVKQRKSRIEHIVNGEIARKATLDTIQTIDSATMAACIIPFVAAS